MKKNKTRKNYNYKPITVLFDIDLDEEKQMYEWLNSHKKKNNGYCAILKRALKEMIEREN